MQKRFYLSDSLNRTTEPQGPFIHQVKMTIDRLLLLMNLDKKRKVNSLYLNQTVTIFSFQSVYKSSACKIDPFVWLDLSWRGSQRKHGKVSLRKQPTFREVSTWTLAKRRLRNERRNSILMTCHYPDLGSASDWLKEKSSQLEALPRSG